ncbi:MFS general substrate transporter [Mycena indigotica]|uniref:MFS general substrate transporter n=1 Tax=Mycena indigotica TaxID=2126181 RepID=A0A8H6W9A5_9AGAR|nr:MFS general substrate transporter [Mycena indigotica]KAF7303924.1 MFS general substrate transporter [Mycena indigotica]
MPSPKETIPLNTEAILPPLVDSNHEDHILTGKRLAVVFAAMLLSILLIALDQTILATALPRIASEFRAFSLQGWVSSSFILAQTVFILFFGQTTRIFVAKHILLVGVSLFEIGSLVCGLTNDASQLIAGRTVSGVGAAAIYVSTIQIVTQVTRLQDRPKLFGIFGAVFAVSSIIGPLMGGAFTDKISWRWCFYINLPIGGVSLITVTLLLEATPPLGSEADHVKRTWTKTLSSVSEIDYVGVVLVAGAVTTLMLSLQWGSNTKEWGDKDLIICFIFAAVLALLFIMWQVRKRDKALMPLEIFHSRSMYALTLYCMLTRFSLLIFSYYIPVFYQADRHYSAIRSGVNLLPFSLGTVITIILTAQITSKIGYYWPWLVVAPVFLALGSGFLFTVSRATSSGTIIGFQILVGIGIGLAMQNTLVAIQAEFNSKPALLGQATSTGTFAQFLGGTIGLGVAEPVFSSRLTATLAKYSPSLPPNLPHHRSTITNCDLYWPSRRVDSRRGRCL